MNKTIKYIVDGQVLSLELTEQYQGKSDAQILAELRAVHGTSNVEFVQGDFITEGARLLKG